MICLSASVATVSLANAQAIDERLWGLRMIGVDQARDAGFTGAGVKIGVMDNGSQADHPEYADRWQDGVSIDGTVYAGTGDHGTHVAGTILAVMSAWHLRRFYTASTGLCRVRATETLPRHCAGD